MDTKEGMKDFSEKLIHWYELNKRDLPWRNTKDPYYIWLSEIILQQTRVLQGLPYYEKFTSNFPTIQHLASASEDHVLSLWEGLGYYSRARNLHHTAKNIHLNLKGEFPITYDEIIKLKGIGPYTAAAIASFAFNEVKPVLDGNVARVISRIFGVFGPGDTNDFKKQIEKYTNELIDPNRPASFNQAIMEFGATFCTPANPPCEECIFKTRCFAYQKGMVTELPEKKKKLKRRERFLEYFILEFDKKIFLKKRNQNEIWEGLYEPVLIEADKKQVEKVFMKEVVLKKIIGHKSAIQNMSITEYQKHVLSHQDLYVRFWHLALSTLPEQEYIKEYKLIEVSQLTQYGMPIVIKKHLSSIF